MRDTATRKRRRALAGVVLIVLGAGCAAFGVYAGQQSAPPAVSIDPVGVTAVPETRFYQRPWVLYGDIEDPRRVPTLTDLGCEPGAGISAPPQPDDMTRYGSRVIDGDSIAAIAVLSRSGDGATLRCSDAGDHAPLWLLPSSDAPPFAPNGMVLAGILIAVGGALIHPSIADLPLRARNARSSGR